MAPMTLCPHFSSLGESIITRVLLANRLRPEHPGQTQTQGKAGIDEVLLLHFLSAKPIITYATLLPHANLVPLIPAGLHLKH